MIINIGTATYSLAALAFLLFTMLLATSWRGRFHGALLLSAAAITALWAVSLAYLSVSLHAVLLAHTLEIARDVAWLLFLLRLFDSPEPAAHKSRLISLVAAGVGISGAVLIGYGFYAFHTQTSAPLLTILTRLVYAVIGMALVEQLFRNARAERRWAIKYLCVGLGGMFAYDFYLYSDAMLFKHVDSNLWMARGVVNALIVPFLAVSTARNPQWSIDVFVSRRIVFHTVTLIGAGVYLLVMAGAGYYIRIFGGTWGTVFQTAFLFGALVMLFSVLFSGALRARLKVFVAKNFFSYKYDYRDEWLKFTRTLAEGEPGVRLRERTIEALAELIDSPGGALWFYEERHGFAQLARWNMPASTGIEVADSDLAKFLETRQWVINLDEHEKIPELYNNLRLPEWLGELPRAWLIVPLILHHRLLGFVVLERSRGVTKFNWEDSDLLKTAARQVAVYLAQIDAAEALLVARQFESFNRLSAFVVHDLKNVIAQLSLMLKNAARHRDNPAFLDDMIDTVDNSVQKMQRLLDQLHNRRAESSQLTDVNIATLLRHVIQEKGLSRPAPTLELGCDNLVVSANAERLARVVGHLLQNAIEATPETGQVAVRLDCDDDSAVIDISDNGCGMDEAFVRHHLFRPFDSTKGSGMGIGAYECKEYVRELGGRIDVKSAIGQGTRFTIIIPAKRMAELTISRG